MLALRLDGRPIAMKCNILAAPARLLSRSASMKSYPSVAVYYQ